MLVRSIPMVFRKHEFVARVEQLRVELGMTQQEIEELAGYAGYRQFKTGVSKDIQVGNFLALCNALDMNPLEFFELAP